MTLTVADIDRWSAEAVRDVFHAGTARGQATLEASRQLSTLSVFDSWEGATAEARRHTNASIRQDLNDHGNESLMVAKRPEVPPTASSACSPNCARCVTMPPRCT